jgi:predicted secreted protein
MRRLRLLALAIPLIAAAPALAQEKVVLQLGESAERVVTQDRIRAHLRVELGGNDPRALQGQVNQKMTVALDRAKAVAAVKAETQGYFVYEDKTLKRGQRWFGSQSLTLTSFESGALLALVGQLQEDGLLIQGLGYELAPETRRRIERELVPDAIQRIKDTAATVAKSLDLPKVEIVKVRLGETQAPPTPRFGGPVMAMAERAQIAPPVAEPGEASVTIRIEAEVALSR